MLSLRCRPTLLLVQSVFLFMLCSIFLVSAADLPNNLGKSAFAESLLVSFTGVFPYTSAASPSLAFIRLHLNRTSGPGSADVFANDVPLQFKVRMGHLYTVEAT